MESNSSSSHGGPTKGRDRIDSLDTLRGFALLGILVMNIQSFSMPASAYFIPTLYGELNGANGLVWLLGNLFFDLKFLAIFSILFGAGIVLMTQHRDAAGQPVISVHFRRMILLLLFGLGHAYCIWYGDILAFYAVCGMLVVWVRRWPAHRLALAGAALVTVGSLVFIITGLGVRFIPEVAEGIRAEYTPSGDQLSEEIEAYRSSWSTHFPLRLTEALTFQLGAFPFMLFWRISGLMLLGMALFKWGVLSASHSVRFYLRMTLTGCALGLPLVALGAYWNYRQDFDPAVVLGFGALPNWFGSIGVAFMWLGLVMGLCRANIFCSARAVLSAYGRMAFTNYIGQSIIATWVFYGFGLGLFGSLDRLEQFGVVAAILTVQLIASALWLNFFRFGPLEWIWRSGVYARLEPILRAD